MHYNNKHHLSKQEKDLLKKLTEEQQEFLEKLADASQEFEMFSAEMEDMKGSVDNMDNEIKEKEPMLNKTIVSTHDALRSVSEYYKDVDMLAVDEELANMIHKVNLALFDLEDNFKSLLK